MSAGPTISPHKILAASRGDSASLLEVLQQVAQVAQQQQQVTGTVPKAYAGGRSSSPGPTVSPGKVNPSAPTPPQATGSVSILDSTYIVQLVNPGGSSPVSSVQAQQQAATATPITSLQPVTPVYHQIRASTSPAFNVNSNTQVFGGTTGSTQTYWPLSGLGTGTFYIQFRSSYDGINWNNWRNANGGTALGGLVSQVTTEDAGDSTWALFTLPGSMIVGCGAAELSDKSIFDLPQQLVSSGMFAIAGPNGFSGQGNGVSGFTLSDVDIEVPQDTSGQVGLPDYPVQIRMQMAIADTPTVFPAVASVFAICFDPSNPAVKLYPKPGGGATWAVFRLPGGARIAIGQGKDVDGATIWTPPTLGWIDGSRLLSICSLTDATVNKPPVTGINAARLTGLIISGSYLDDGGGAVGGQSVNWLAIAYQPGAVITSGFIEIPLQGGHAVILGSGQVASGTVLTLPAGFSAANSLAICTPGGCDNNGRHMRGVQTCALFGNTPTLTYTDNSNVWSGNVNWFRMCWK